MNLIPHFSRGACWQVHNGESTAVWQDPWVLGMPHFKLRPRLAILEEWRNEKIGSLISSNLQQWDRMLLHQRFDEEIVRCILQIPFNLQGGLDRWVWTLDSSSHYTLKSMYRSLLPPFDEDASPLSMHKWKLL